MTHERVSSHNVYYLYRAFGPYITWSRSSTWVGIPHYLGSHKARRRKFPRPPRTCKGAYRDISHVYWVRLRCSTEFSARLLTAGCCLVTRRQSSHWICSLRISYAKRVTKLSSSIHGKYKRRSKARADKNPRSCKIQLETRHVVGRDLASPSFDSHVHHVAIAAARLPHENRACTVDM